MAKYGTAGPRKTMEISLSFMSHYAICHPAQQILHHATKSYCKGPILATITMQNCYTKACSLSLHKTVNGQWQLLIRAIQILIRNLQ